MATLPIFQKRGVGTSVVQDVSIAPQQAAISGMGSLDQAVSRMTAYFQSQAATDAKTAAVKYAAENPLTEDQVKNKLATPEKLRVEGAGSIFQQTYEGMQAQILGNNLLLEHTAEIGEISGRIEAGETFDLRQLQVDLKDRRDGVVTLLNEIDPQVAIQVSKGIAQAGNSLLKIGAKKQAETQIGLARAKAVDVVNRVIPALEMQIEQQVGGDYQQTAAQVAAGEKPVQITASDIIADGAALVETVAVAAQSPEIYDDFIKQSRQAVVNVVVKQMTTAGVASNGGSAMGMLDSGNLGRFSQMYKRELTLTEKTEIRKSVISYWGDKHAVGERARIKQEREETRAAVGVWNQWDSREIDDDQLVQRLQSLNQLTGESLLKIRSGGGPGASAVDYSLILTATQNNGYGQTDINSMLENKTVNLSQWTKLNSELNQVGTDLGNAKAYINKMSGVPEGLDIAGSFATQRAASARLQGQLLKQQAEATQSGIPFDPMTAAENLVKSATQSDPGLVGVAADKAELNRLLVENGLSEDSLVYSNVGMIKSAGVKDDAVARRIAKLTKSITGSKN